MASYRAPVDFACVHTQLSAFTASEALPTVAPGVSDPPNMFADGLAWLVCTSVPKLQILRHL
eukprot:5669708-Prymnesium_polylepis.1